MSRTGGGKSVVLTVLLAAGCSSAAPEPIWIGHLAPLSGPDQLQGESATRSMQVTLEKARAEDWTRFDDLFDSYWLPPNRKAVSRTKGGGAGRSAFDHKPGSPAGKAGVMTASACGRYTSPTGAPTGSSASSRRATRVHSCVHVALARFLSVRRPQ